MSFKLEIEFVGLCLFVPGTGPTVAPAMRVLLPAAGHDGPDHDGDDGHGADDVPGHVAMLCFDAAYLERGADSRHEVVALASIDRQDLFLAGLDAPGVTLPKALVDVGAIAKGKVDPGALDGGDPAQKLTARVRLGSGEQAGSDTGACWSLEALSRKPLHLPNRVYWTMTIDEDHLALALTPLDGGERKVLPRLYPIRDEAGVPRIQLSVYNTPHNELPPAPVRIPEPVPGKEAGHFKAFYPLFVPVPCRPPLPRFVARDCGDTDGEDVGEGTGGREVPWFKGGSPYTCMAAQSPPVISE